VAVLPDNYHGFRSAERALHDILAIARGPNEVDITFLLDEQPVVTLDGRDVRGGWLTVNDAVDISFGIDFTTGRLHIADGFGRSPTPLQSTGTGASRRAARQGVREWPAVLHDIATLGRQPRERPELVPAPLAGRLSRRMAIRPRQPRQLPHRRFQRRSARWQLRIYPPDQQRLGSSLKRTADAGARARPAEA
jgi:hypothetical protein